MSIWLTQFIKAMRDEEGKMVKNAHLIGTLRRILKLLYHRIRPVFVFDGRTPALKERVVRLRRKTLEKHVRFWSFFWFRYYHSALECEGICQESLGA